MIEAFTKIWFTHSDRLRMQFSAKHPDSYREIVEAVVRLLHNVIEDNWSNSEEAPDPQRIHEIDDGDYQGVLLYVIAASGYQPDRYWFVKVSYGSCSVCDTLQSIRSRYYDEDAPPSSDQVNAYMTLALHIVQGLKVLGGDPILD